MGIHVITLMADLEACTKCHTVGWYVDEEEAFKAVMENRGGMEECLYDYAVIEEVPPGVYAIPSKEAWFKWNGDEGKFMPISKPEEIRSVVCFYG